MSPTPIEEFEARRWELALGVSQLLETPTAWRHRRTERFEIRSADEVRRHVAVDFTVPPEVWGDLLLRPAPAGAAREEALRTGHDGEWVLPLGWLARGPLVGFDLRQDGAALPLLLSSEIEIVTRAVLELELDLALASPAGASASDLAARCTALIAKCVRLHPPDGTAAEIEQLASDYGDLVTSLVELMRASLNGFLLLVVVPRVDRRQIVKLAYDEAVPRGGPRSTIGFDTPGVVESATSHFECPLPVELRARTWVMEERDSGEKLSEEVTESDHPSLYVRADEVQKRIDSLDGVESHAAHLRVRAEHEIPLWRFHWPAVALAAAATTVVAYGGWKADLGSAVQQGRGGSIATLLLAGFALFVALLLRLDEHSLARRMLRGPRLVLTATLLVALVAAAALAFAGKETTHVWRAGSIVLAVLLAVLLWSVRSSVGARLKWLLDRFKP